MVQNMIRLMLGFQKLYLPIFPELNWEEKVNIKMQLLKSQLSMRLEIIALKKKLN